ncbi:trypsin-1-like [Eupeodes corollae]|uniref:trypsin-1-like n=1 Tax=Eupeodes corollae TaxID=290404 RepID=UPI002490760E|nr:trypsin-1-like [Eupeodes corollae]
MSTVHLVATVFLISLITIIAASPLNDVRIINGTVAIADNTHHQVSIRMKDIEYSFGEGHVCGGSLIAPNVVLTAAHCFYDDWIKGFFSYEIYFVVMGTLDRFEETKNTVSIDVAEIIYNDFNRPTFERDIALLVLKENFPLSNPLIDLIPLNKDILPVGTVCQVTGWGTTENGDMSKALMTVDVPVVDSEICSENYGEGAIFDAMICAGYMEGGKDACQGDSGGPMVYNGKLAGIVSFGDGCGSPGFPGVYTSVSHYVDWIEEKLANISSFQPLTPDDVSCKGNSSVLAPDNNDCKGNSANSMYLSSFIVLLVSFLLASF